MSEVYVHELIEELSQRPEVEAVILAGSRAGEQHDALSDYDLYVYLSEPLDPEIRKAITGRYCRYMELANRYWEEEDDGVLKSGEEIELIYRNLDDFTRTLESSVMQHNASVGYSTCFWYNLLNSEILYDQRGRYAALQRRFSVEYSPGLATAIVEKNLPLLLDVIPAYPKQIGKALKRGDRISVHHRLTEYLASYFDVLFAINHQPHPGEKRMLEYAELHCPLRPDDFRQQLDTLFGCVGEERMMDEVRKLSEQLALLVKESPAVRESFTSGSE